MKVEVLISTMHQNDYDLLKRINLQSNAVVINQCDCNSQQVFMFGDYRVKWINTTERGISKSRNMAIQNACSDYCLFVDDDEILANDYASIIKHAFEAYNCDIIRFMATGIERVFKNYPKKNQKIGFLSSMKISSVEIAFKVQTIRKLGVLFDEDLGAGSDFLMGEENVFLFDCLRKKMNIYFCRTIICNLHLGNSSWFKGYNKEYFIGRGASFCAMRTKFTKLLICQFAIRRWKQYRKDCSLCSAIRYMLEGKNKYLELKRGQ